MKEQKYLDKGYVRLIDSMGSDKLIEAAARQSYNEEPSSRTADATRNLIRYLFRHQHTSPFEMAEFVFQIKLPIFVMRQLVRHRTASINELSLRYTKAPEDYYIPPMERMVEQSNNNKQCSSDTPLSEHDQALCYAWITDSSIESRENYNALLGAGLNRETARIVLPLNQYTVITYKQDLKNLLHMIALRNHPHAQVEIQELARIMYDLIKQDGRFDYTLEAFEDYQVHGCRLSRAELECIAKSIDFKALSNAISHSYELSKREAQELLEKIRPSSR